MKRTRGPFTFAFSKEPLNEQQASNPEKAKSTRGIVVGMPAKNNDECGLTNMNTDISNFLWQIKWV